MKKQYESPAISIIQLTGGPMMETSIFIPPSQEDDTPSATRRRSIWGDDEKQETSSPWN